VWTAYRQGRFVVHVDDAIVPPERWAVELPTTEGRHLRASWIGVDRHETPGQIPLVNPPERHERQGWYERFYSGPHAAMVIGWLLATMLAVAGIHLGLLDSYGLWEALVPIVLLLVLAVRWLWRRFHRVDASAS
jgi:hypothetical protein